jgi:CRISPR-associated endonuclease/helicase Cas3/CRISPR-associated endonuclease Cas3-HD
LAAELSPEDGPIEEVATVAAKLHDFGKLTEWFQSYIRSVDAGHSPTLSRNKRRKKQHARISAYAAEYALHKRGIDGAWRTLAFLTVAKHHQSLPNTEDAIQRSTNLKRSKNRQRFDLVQKQLENIHRTASAEADALLRETTGGDGSLDGFTRYMMKKRTHATLSDFKVEETTYERLLHLWGILIAADKLAAAGLDIYTAPPHSPERIERHIASFPAAERTAKQHLNALREQARQGVLRRLDDFHRAETNLATITLPTGFGKTLTGVQAASILADELSCVVYAFPYTSILDQTDEVLQAALDVTPASPEYTVHHHLAETRTLPDAVQVDTDAAELLAETWQAPLVLTTFVQLFESLAGPTNSQGVKIPSLENAVVLLDEPQALPERWWRFIAWTIDLLTREFNATVVLMTATQPRLLEYLPHTDEPFELVPKYNQYFDFLSESPRVRYRLDDSVQSYLTDPRTAHPRPLNDAVTELLSAEGTQVLSVGNTVASVAEVGPPIGRRSLAQRTAGFGIP